ncbi:MAG: hypothetical protein CME63_07455 [Halobacteriovoraceae bacterium]|nr:hypothetical protein [Halobacteriovoraceae bacterium]|tara:strand:- start:9683 stop:10585 length:903 start_codon:yes stop_codon:yes gene_type:complete
MINRSNLLIFVGLFFGLSFNGNAKTIKLKAQSERRTDVRVKLPRKFEKKEKWPLLISLHGYGGNSLIQKYYIRLGHYENQFGYVYTAPNGIKNNEGKRFWNASEFCCNFDPQIVDDVSYIKNLIHRITTSPEIGRIDLSQIYLIGYSNGAFLASKIACESDLPIAGIVTISGTGDLRGKDQQLFLKDKIECSHNRPIKVLHIHGTEDETIRYQGFDNGKTAHVSAIDHVTRWANHNGCKGSLEKKPEVFNASNFVKGKETERYAFEDCEAKVEHYKIKGGAHFAVFKKKFTKSILEFLLK